MVIDELKNDAVLALDFGGTKLTAAVVDPVSGKIIAQVRCLTPSQRGAIASLELMIQAGREALASTPASQGEITSIGVSFGGPVSQDRRTVLRSMHIADWESYDLAACL